MSIRKEEYLCDLSEVRILLHKQVQRFNAILLLSGLVVVYASSFIIEGVYAIPIILMSYIILPTYFISIVMLHRGILQSFFEAFNLSSTLIMFIVIILTSASNNILFLRLSFATMVSIIILISYATTKKVFHEVNEKSMRDEARVRLTSLIISIFILMVAYLVSINIQRLYTPDETSYVFNVQLFEQLKIIPSFGVSPLSSEVSKYIAGRFIWPSYLYSLKILTQSDPYYLHLSATLFIALLAPVVMGFLYDVLGLKDLRAILWITMLAVLSPVVFPWSSTALLDLPQSYFILISLYFILRSVSYQTDGTLRINMLKLCLGFIYAFYSVLFKSNILTLAMAMMILIIELHRYRQHLAKTSAFALKILTIVVMSIATIYIAIDIARFVSWYFFGNWNLANSLRKYLIFEVSIVEYILGAFMEFPWDRYTVFSYSWKQWLDFLDFALAPEALTVIVSAIFLIMPLLIAFIRESHKEVMLQTKILICTTYISFWLYFIALIGNNELYDLTRYGLHLYILIVTMSWTLFYRLLEKYDRAKLMLIGIAAWVLITINKVVSLEFGGTRFFFDMLRYKYSAILILSEMVILMILPLILHKHVNAWKNVFRVTLLALIVPIMIFNNAVFSNSYLFTSTGLSAVGRYLESMSDVTGRKIVVSNAYIYLRNYLNLNKFTPIPPPISETELKDFLKFLPNGSILVLTDDPSISWYEYSNAYIKEYVSRDFIPIEYVGPSKKLGDPRLEVTADSITQKYVIVNGSVVKTPWGKGISLNGSGQYIAVYNYSLGDEYTIELLFRIDEDPSGFGLYSESIPGIEGQPITKPLLAKRYFGYEEIIISITSRGQVIAYADSRDDKPRFRITTGEGVIKNGEWYHLVLTVENSEARVYINGLLVGTSKVTGRNIMLAEMGIKNEPLYIGSDGRSDYKPWRYLKATIQMLRIYDKPFKLEEIMSVYENLRKVNQISFGGYKYAIYLKDEARVGNGTPATEITPIRLSKVYMHDNGTCIMHIESEVSSKYIISTIRFSKIVNIDGGNKILYFPYYYNDNMQSVIEEGNYICSFSTIINQEGDFIAIHADKSMNLKELLIYYITFPILLVLTIAEPKLCTILTLSRKRMRE